MTRFQNIHRCRNDMLILKAAKLKFVQVQEGLISYRYDCFHDPRITTAAISCRHQNGKTWTPVSRPRAYYKTTLWVHD